MGRTVAPRRGRASAQAQLTDDLCGNSFTVGCVLSHENGNDFSRMPDPTSAISLVLSDNRVRASSGRKTMCFFLFVIHLENFMRIHLDRITIVQCASVEKTICQTYGASMPDEEARRLHPGETQHSAENAGNQHFAG